MLVIGDFEDDVFTKRSSTTVSAGFALSSALNGAVTEGALDDEKEANCEKRLNSVAVPSL